MIRWARESWRILQLFVHRMLEVGSCLIVMLPQLAQIQYLPAGLLLPHASVSVGSIYADLLGRDALDYSNGQTRGGPRFLALHFPQACSLTLSLAWLSRIGDLLCCDLATANVLLYWRAPPPPTLSSSAGKPSP
ncbi:MAG: hypothetical protein HY267_08065 [Deltaproteobacteria bacterium]|nr:hypothetical protein [Deltaproteobacteria bacterium]